MTRHSIIHSTFVFVCFSALLACGSARYEVVVYTALDELYSRPILDAFEERTGIRVRAQYDTEASKTTGLVNRLIAEKDRPRADVFWNNEAAQTIVLKNNGVLEPYRSPAAGVIPDHYKDVEGYWTGFAARGRVVIYNKDLTNEPPRTVRDFLDPKWSGKAAIANPLFGTTATHAAALFAIWGDDEAKTFFRALKENSVAILPGNATVRDLVARGEYAVGLTDTDDANGAVEDGYPVGWHLVDAEPGGLGALIIPNTVALIRGGPNPDAARKFIDFLLSEDVELALSRMRSLQIPLNPAVNPPETVPKLAAIHVMDVSFDAVAKAMARSAPFIQNEFLLWP